MRDLVPMGKSLPNNEYAEKLVLGLCIFDPKCLSAAKSILKGESFYNQLSKKIFNALCHAENEGQVTAITVQESSKRLGQEVNLSNITELLVGLSHVSIGQFIVYCRLIEEKAIDRDLIRQSNQIVSEIYSEEADTRANFQKLESLVNSFASRVYGGDVGYTENGFQSLFELKGDFKEHLEQLKSNIKMGTETGIKDLDDMLDGGGLQPNGLYFLAALAKSGKTALMLRIVRNIGFSDENNVVLIVTAEMNKLNMLKRLYSPYAGVPYSHFRPGIYGESYRIAIENLSSFSNNNIKVATTIFTIDELKNKLRKEHQEALRLGKRIAMIMVDYVQLFSISGNSNADWKFKSREVGEVSLQLKRLSVELGVPVFAISSLNRDPAKENREPELNDLRESGQLEYDAEAVMFLHNPKYTPGVAYVRQEVEEINLLIKAQRNGPTGRIPMNFVGRYMEFLTMEELDIYAGGDSNSKSVEDVEEIW